MLKKSFAILKRDGFIYTMKRFIAFCISKTPFAHKIGFQFIDNLKLTFAPSRLTYAIFANRNERKGDYKIIMDSLNPGNTMIDVGGNIGTTALVGAKAVGSTGRVLVFEPSPKFAKIIRDNVSLNKLQDVVSVYEVALGAIEGTVYLNEAVADDTTNHISDNGTPVTQAPLDNFTTALSKIDFLKIDVEGYELEVLKGAQNTLAKTKVIYIEFIPRLITRAGATPTEVIDVLRQHFELFTLSPSGTRVPFAYTADSDLETDIIGINTMHA